jgi:hypothetical protein
MQKKKVSCAPLSKALGGSPFRGLTKNQTKDTVPDVVVGVQCEYWLGFVDIKGWSSYLGMSAVWEYQARHAGALPSGEESTLEELRTIADDYRKAWGINEKFMKGPPEDVLS